MANSAGAWLVIVGIILIIGVVTLAFMWNSEITGDVIYNESETTPGRFYCTPASRDVEACTFVYDPVCGWSSDSAQSTDFSNSCLACMNENISYWIEGTC